MAASDEQPLSTQEAHLRIALTGGNGKAGRWVVRDLRDHGHSVQSE
jgi:nucleoside-diphosphate-sugar epimerase